VIEPLTIIGIGHDGPGGLSPQARGHVATAKVLAGGKRHLAFFPEFAGETLTITSDIPALIERLKIASQNKKTVVLASGDPLFYGIGASLLAAFPKDRLQFLPHVSSIQLVFAALKASWHDARVVSLHGRPIDALLPVLAERVAKIAILTDGQNHPAAIASFLSLNGFGNEFDLWVGEDLGSAAERLSQWSTVSIAGQEFSPLNVLVLLRKAATAPPTDLEVPLLGIPEQQFAQRDERRGMITKRETRLLSLAYLGLRPGHVVWDVGAGSGSVSVEAARLSPTLRVFAIERSEAAVAHIEENIRRFGLSTVEAILGSAPDVFPSLPAPAAIFVGGSGGRLEEILTQSVERLPSGGRLVMNCITIENFAHAWRLLEQLGMGPQATSVQLAHSRPLGSLHALEPDNPILILRGSKP
jgi:precorrin-6Y C5,15-methyltransferase (decarboxylating)